MDKKRSDVCEGVWDTHEKDVPQRKRLGDRRKAGPDGTAVSVRTGETKRLGRENVDFCQLQSAGPLYFYLRPVDVIFIQLTHFLFTQNLVMHSEWGVWELRASG